MVSRRRLIAGVVAMWIAVTAAVDAIAGGAIHFVEFLARPSSCLVGHAFVQIGTIDGSGRARSDRTVALYPAWYPRTDRAALVDAPGRIMATVDDRPERASARYRVEVSANTYRAALVHARRMAAQWTRYDLATENCNRVLFEFADRLGLQVNRDMLDLPQNIVSGMIARNGGRSRASWRPELRP